MSKANCKADGALPSGVDFPVFRPVGEMVAGLQAVAAATLAVSLVGLPHVPGLPQAPAEIAAPVKTAAQAVRPLIPPESLAGPSAAALAPDPRTILKGLLRQAGLRPTLDPHQLSWTQARRVNALLPAGQSTADIARPFHLDVATKDGGQALKCLTQAAYYEAGANGPEAQGAVVQVVLNRLRHPDFPKSVCGVVYEGADRDTGCQFTFTCDGSLKRPVDATAWSEARKVAQHALAGYVDRAVGTATYYHADYVFPTWAPALVKMATVGPHIFYRMAGPEGAAAYLTGRYAGNELKLVRAVLLATDKHTQKAGSKAEPKLEAKVEQAAVPAGLRTEASRLQRVRVEIAAATPKADHAPIVETASIGAAIQTTLQAAAPPAIQAPVTLPAATAAGNDSSPAA